MSERHEVEAWLGDDHGLNGDQIDVLTGLFGDIADRYPNPDDEAKREASRIMAYRLLAGDAAAIDEHAAALARARLTVEESSAALRQAALMVVEPGTRGDRSEAAFARRAGVDRMTMRKWRRR